VAGCPSIKLSVALLCALLAAACGNASAPASNGTLSGSPTAWPSVTAPTPEPMSPTASAHASASVRPSDPPVLSDGPITPGTYIYVLQQSCDSPDCPPQASPRAPIHIEITVPSGWETFFGGLVIHPGSTEGPGGAALVMGWTTFWVGLNSDPCLQAEHEIPDIEVGPTVDDFVDAVVAHPALDVSEPADVELGGHSGRFLTLTGPSDISGCNNWRPWDPGFYVQGPDNLWDIWVIDVDGSRVVIIAEHFPGTPADVKTELREMVDSIRFVP
jgi:hypothetical protein